ncbi:MAG: hypothetical protein ACREVQ_07365 [Burkholderiales bacterium]
MRRASLRSQRGVALLALLAVAVMVFAYLLTSRLNAASQFVAINRDHNAQVMAQAKEALVGWMAINAAGTDANPGRLPCPEAPGYFGDPAQEGIAAGSCLPPNNVGRLPWRTLGLERSVDASGEPLWYAVSPGWSLPGASTAPVNSDTGGQLAFNGENDVALIFAPGAAMTVLAGGPCAGRVQTRPAAGPPDVRNYLECGNEAGSYVAGVPGQTFNDQVLRVATTDVVPLLEAAIQERMQREIAPALRGVYASAPWKRNSTNNLVSTNPLYPFAAPFGNPQTASFLGANGTSQGLLPFVYSETSPGSGIACTGDPRCNPLAVVWTGGTLSGPSIHSPSCSVVTGTTTRLDCSFYYTCLLIFCTLPTLDYTIQAQASGVGMALRRINLAAPVGSANVNATLSSASAIFNTAGGIALTLTGTATPNGSGGFLSALLGNILCGLPIVGAILGCKLSLISVPIGVLADHPLLDANDATTGWFVRNEWYKLVFYAVADQSTPVALPNHGCDSTNCLRFNEGLGCGGGSEWCNIRALLVLGGASLSGASRPNGNLADYFEYQNGDGGSFYEQHPMRRATNVANPNGPWNDRVILVDWLPPPSQPLIDVTRASVIGKHPQVAQASDSPPRLYVLP